MRTKVWRWQIASRQGGAVSVSVVTGRVPQSAAGIAARIAALASPGQLLATQSIANAAAAKGILVRGLGKVALRSVVGEIPLYEIELAPSPDPAWIDPVCKMHAPYASYRRAVPEGLWFCSPRCEDAYRKSPQAFPLSR
jgi:adenylate cyclase